MTPARPADDTASKRRSSVQLALALGGVAAALFVLALLFYRPGA